MTAEEQPEIRILTVGESLDPDRQLWPEGAHYNLPAGEHELCLYYGSPKVIEVASVNHGVFHFGFVVIDPLIFLCFRAGALPWADAPFSWHRMDPDHRVLPSVSDPREHAVLRVILADANDHGRVAALRLMTFSPWFTYHLHRAMLRQAARPAPTHEEYQACVRSTYERYTSEQVAHQCRWRCRGGE